MQSTTAQTNHEIIKILYYFKPIYMGFLSGCAVCQTGICIWAASVGMPPTALMQRRHGIILDATHEQGVNIT